MVCKRRFASGFSLDAAFITEHRTTALFGPSGAGKSSLLMAIAGLLRADEARIVWNDRVLTDTSVRVALAPEKRRLGVVFQDQRLFPHLSVERNLRFGERRRHESDAPAAPFDRIVGVLDLEPLLGRQPSTLSGGERQRLALGRALMSGPELLLLDEPVAAVDEPRRNAILSYVDRVAHEWNLPMLYVSHHRAEVQRLADWVVSVDAGRVVETGPPDQVLGTEGVLAAGEAVNLMRLENIAADGGTWTGAVASSDGDLRMSLPATSAAPGDSAFVQFAASDVMLASGEVGELSARNRLPATVVDLVPRAGRVFVAVQVFEQRLWAELTSDAVDDLGLAPGTPVTCLIKSAALRLLE